MPSHPKVAKYWPPHLKNLVEDDDEVSSREVDEKEGHLGSFFGQYFPGELVEGEDVDADAEREQDAESCKFSPNPASQKMINWDP